MGRRNIKQKAGSLIFRIYHYSIFSGLLHRMKQYAIFAIQKLHSILQAISTIPRRCGYADRRFKALRALKGQYMGKRCFIICTGPSLLISDLEKLENEYSFGMNSISLIHEKTRWKPDFYAIQDLSVFERIKESVYTTDNGQVFIPLEFSRHYVLPENWVMFHTSWAYHMYELIYKTKYFAKFSRDCYATVYDGYSITYSIMQLAIYMGFTEIYLLGADSSYLGEKKHFIEHGTNDPTFQTATDRLFSAYSVAKKFTDKNGIKVYNATRGGKLEIFPRVNLDELLKTSKKNKVNT
ncbi:MAG: 6-hydroxymethylpterin diphosphokinase MptE-like protein [Candidatus Izemoplasmatales bacterium]